tara:strand:- start:44284 stop:44430 length:147 start_codon:yes stop_codon:yes gene_type:complete
MTFSGAKGDTNKRIGPTGTCYINQNPIHPPSRSDGNEFNLKFHDLAIV